MSEGVVPSLPRPEKLKTIVNHSGEELRLRCRNRQWAAGCFLMLWLTGWTVACVVLGAAVILKRQLFIVLFAIPFWASWVLVFALLLKTFFQYEELTFGPDGISYLRRVFIRLRRRSCAARRDSWFRSLFGGGRFRNRSAAIGHRDSHHGACDSAARRAIGRRTGMAPHAARHLFAFVARIESRTGRSAHVAGTGSAPAATAVAATAVAADDVEVLTAAGAAGAPPIDSAWRYQESFDDFSVSRRGRLSLAAVLGLLFVTVFWNGIVSVFVMVLFGLVPLKNPQPIGGAWWGLFFFLIPFEVIGLLIIGALIGVLVEPLHRTAWIFGADDIRLRQRWIAAGWSRRWPADRLERLELHRVATNKNRGSLTTANETYYHQLLFVAADNEELCSIKRLTEGEARWIGGLLLRERSAWFR